MAPLLRWQQPHKQKIDAYSIIVAVPHVLKDLLPLSLRFIRHTMRANLHQIILCFDRPNFYHDEKLIALCNVNYPDLPLKFCYLPTASGLLATFIDRSKFYASLAWVTGLDECQTRYAIIHDFDLFPVLDRYFDHMYEILKSREMYVLGREWTDFGGLQEADCIYGSWGLGLNVEWIVQSFRPIDCFHRIDNFKGTKIDFDPFCWIQSKTSRRCSIETHDDDFVHFVNIVSTYQRWMTGQKMQPEHCLHSAFYLLDLVGFGPGIKSITDKMLDARSGVFSIDDRIIDFSYTNIDCARVVDHKICRLEKLLFGFIRKPVIDYIREFYDFLQRHGGRSRV